MAENEEAAKPNDEVVSTSEQSNKSKDRWDKIDILLKPVGGLFTGIVLAIVGFVTTNILEEQQAVQTERLAKLQEEETNRRLFAEIMSSQERSDSALRKEMFNSIIRTFLNPRGASLDERVLALELLAYNFHHAIDLSPLFKHVAKLIEESTVENRISLQRQLERVASEVIDKQLATLADGGVLTTFSLSFDQLDRGGVSLDERLYPIRADQPELKEQRYIFVEALYSNPEAREIKVRLESGSPDDRFNPEVDIVFNVGFFDFPMIDNTRVSHSQRIGIALRRWSDYGAELALIYYPGIYDEVLDQLQKTTKALNKRGQRNEQ